MEALTSSAITDGKNGSGGDEPSRLLTPEMMRQLHGTDIDAATAQKVLDDSTTLATRAQQADAEMDRREERQREVAGSEIQGLQEELANTEKDDASTVSTVMAVAMAGRAIQPSLDLLQQLVKSQRENVTEVIENEQRQIETLKSRLDEEVRRNEELEADFLQMEREG